MGIATDAFADFAVELLAQQRAAGLAVTSVEHPVGGISAAQAAERLTDGVVTAIAQGLEERA